MSKKIHKIAVFGVFDGLHKGHQHLLQEAAKQANELHIILAQDATVQLLKQKQPKQNEQERKQQLENLPFVHKVWRGDSDLGTYKVLNEVRPDAIAFGYDQTELEQDLSNWLNTHKQSIAFKHIQAYKPETYKSSLIHAYD